MKKGTKFKESIKLLYITQKQIIFSILIILFLFITNINSNSSDSEINQKIIKFKINGDILITDSKGNIIVENINLNSPLVFTKINEKNINFKDNNVLPTQNGELNYIDPYQHITLLDISLEEFYINSPMIIKNYPNLLFISNRTMSLFALNLKNGSIYNLDYYPKNILNINDLLYINEICPKNKNDVLFLRIDYFLQMKYTFRNNKNMNDKFNDIIWNSHYVKILPIYPYMNIEKNNNYIENNNNENDDYYIFKVIENKNINLIYSQDMDIFRQIKDIQNEYNFNNYYFGNNKRKHLFEYNIINKDEKVINLNFKFLKKLFLLIIIFVLSVFSFKIYKSQIIINSYNNYIKNKKKNIVQIKTDIIQNKITNDENNKINDNKNNENNKTNDIKHDENNINNNDNIINNDIKKDENNKTSDENYITDVKKENSEERPKSPRSKSISNLSTICSIEKDNKDNKKKNNDGTQFISLNNMKFNLKKIIPSKKKEILKHSLSKSSISHKKRPSFKKIQSIKHLFKKTIHKSTSNEKEELKGLFETYISDINKNTNDSVINLDFNKSENEEKYKKIFSLIKSEDSSSSEEINLNKRFFEGNFEGELENNFLFYFDNGRLLKTYKDFQFIGKGGFGVVFKATNKFDESQCAIKVMKINLDLKEENEDLKVTQEIKTMLKFKKKNIVRYKTCWFEFNEKRVKKKRQRAMSLEQRNSPSTDFKEDFLEKGEKKIKSRLKKHLKTPLERISSISKELKLAEKQNDEQKKKERKFSKIWDSDDEESDADSLGANKNFIIKEEGEGEDRFINLDDNEKEIENEMEEISDNLDDENENNSENENYIDNDNNEENNSIDENNNIEFVDDNLIDNSNEKGKINKDFSSNSNSKTKNNNETIKDNDDNENDNTEYNNLQYKNNKNESSSKNLENTNSENNYINIEKDSENNSIFEEEIRKEKEEELKRQQLIQNESNNNNSENDSSDEDDDLKNNSEDGLGVSKKKKKKKNKKYPIYFFIQMEYCSGCPMNYYLSHRTCIPSKKLTTYMFYQMCKAVKHIHEGNIIHRDLKPGNIFLIDDYIIKIGDFGLALNSKSNQNKQGGTYLYQSPEQINNKPYDEKVDIFALGVILVELVSKFNTEFERSEILQGLKKSIYPEYLKDGHLKEYNLVKKMTTLDPKERPNIKDIFKDNDFIDLINESLNTD